MHAMCRRSLIPFGGLQWRTGDHEDLKCSIPRAKPDYAEARSMNRASAATNLIPLHTHAHTHTASQLAS